MSKQSHHHAKHDLRDKARTGSWMLHNDWRTWVAVAVMVAAIIMYVFSLDDSIVPR